MSAFAGLLVLSLAAAPTPQRNVYVGVHLNDVSDFDLKAGRFKADVTVWVKWLGDETPPPLSFPNAEIEEKESLGDEADGHWRSARWRVQGTFRGEFPVHDFPFDRQTLHITFALEARHGTLVPDLAASGMNSTFSVTGWDYEPFFSARVEDKPFSSDLGHVEGEGRGARQRHVTYSVELARPFRPYLVKFALPLVLIVLVSLLALFLNPERLDVRSAMGITGLLSCIAFHYTQGDTLPAVTYLVAADTLFLAAYVFITLTLVISVVAYRAHVTRPALARTADRFGIIVLPISALAGVWLSVSPALAHAVEEEPDLPPKHAAQHALAHVSVATLETPGGSGLGPLRRCNLVTRTADGHFRPDLAVEAPGMTNASVRLLPDGGMRVRWRVRRTAVWSDGAPITSTDLAFSLALVKDPLRRSIEQVDARTIDVVYADRQPDFLSGFTVFPSHVREQFAVDAGREAWTQAQNEGRLPTCGPYLLETFDAGHSMVLVRNEHVVPVAPSIERIAVTSMSPHAAVAELLDGGLDVVASLTPDALEALHGHDGVRVLEQPGDQVWVLVPNVSKGPLADVRARQALLAIVDRLALVKAVAPLPAYVTRGWRLEPGCAPNKPCGVSVVPPSLTDVGLAKAKLTLAVQTLSSKDATHAIITEQLLQDFKRAGLEVTVVEKAAQALRASVQSGEHEDLVLMSRDSADPGRFMNVPGDSRSLNKPFGAHFDTEMVRRLSAYRSTLYDERRDELELELQAAWFSRLPMLPLFVSSRVAAVRADLLGPDWGHADSLWWNVGEWHRAEIPAEP